MAVGVPAESLVYAKGPVSWMALLIFPVVHAEDISVPLLPLKLSDAVVPLVSSNLQYAPAPSGRLRLKSPYNVIESDVAFVVIVSPFAIVAPVPNITVSVSFVNLYVDHDALWIVPHPVGFPVIGRIVLILLSSIIVATFVFPWNLIITLSFPACIPGLKYGSLVKAAFAGAR